MNKWSLVLILLWIGISIMEIINFTPKSFVIWGATAVIVIFILYTDKLEKDINKDDEG